MNTAQLRSLALETQESAGRNPEAYDRAAELFEKALEVYPAHHPKSHLHLNDKAGLAERAKYCRQCANYIREDEAA